MDEQRRDAKGRFLGRDGHGSVPIDPRPTRQAVRLQPIREDGWKPERRAKFLDVLAETCNVKMACAAVKMSDVGAYKLRRRDATFRRAWRKALAEGYAKLEVQLLERALIGEAKMRQAVEESDAARAVELLGRYSPRTAEMLYRTHRAEALAEDAAADEDDPDASEEEALVNSIMTKLVAARAALIAENAAR